MAAAAPVAAVAIMVPLEGQGHPGKGITARLRPALTAVVVVALRLPVLDQRVAQERPTLYLGHRSLMQSVVQAASTSAALQVLRAWLIAATVVVVATAATRLAGRVVLESL